MIFDPHTRKIFDPLRYNNACTPKHSLLFPFFWFGVCQKTMLCCLLELYHSHAPIHGRVPHLFTNHDLIVILHSAYSLD